MPTILLVEDENAIRRALSIVFQREQFRVLEAKNGEEGLELALAEHPDIIVLDLVMPKMDGLTMIRKIRKDSWGKDVPAIIYSNLSRNEKVNEARELGITDYLPKTDVGLRDVLERVREHLQA
jgi:DNA-binding response OmpR family regulator